MIGGNSALSGGTMWIPGNALMRDEGIPDSVEDGLRYLNGCVEDAGPATSAARKTAYLTEGVRMIDFLRRLGIRINRVKNYATIRTARRKHERAGVTMRYLQFQQTRQLRDAGANLAPVIGYVEEFPELSLVLRTWRGFSTFARVVTRTAWARLTRRPMAANGSALIGRVLHAGLNCGIELWTESPVTDIVVEDGRVTGVKVLREGQERMVRARHGVLIAAGAMPITWRCASVMAGNRRQRTGLLRIPGRRRDRGPNGDTPGGRDRPDERGHLDTDDTFASGAYVSRIRAWETIFPFG